MNIAFMFSLLQNALKLNLERVLETIEWSAKVAPHSEQASLVDASLAFAIIANSSFFCLIVTYCILHISAVPCRTHRSVLSV